MSTLQQPEDSSAPSPRPFSKNERRIFIALIVLGSVLILFFGFRTVRSYVRLQKMGLSPGTTDVEAVRGWMTIPYIATAYTVPDVYLFDKLGIPPEKNRKKSLYQLNSDYDFGEKGEIVEAVKTAIRAYQEEHPSETEDAHE